MNSFQQRRMNKDNKDSFMLSQDIENIARDGEAAGLSKKEIQDIQLNRVQQEYGPSFNKGDFNFLLKNLEGSKIRQNREAQAQERQNIYARGLSSMFSNF